MYLTRISLRPCSYFTFLKKSPQNLHAAVAEAFNGSQRRWRLDPSNNLWVVSGTTPVSPQSLPGDFDTRSLEPLHDALKVGQRVGFRLKANPVKSIAQEQGRGKVHQLTKPEDQRLWLEERAERLGLNLESFQIVDAGTESFSRRGEKIGYTWCTFDGVGTVTDPEALMDSIVNGVGKKGGYGCGLFTIVPVATNSTT